MDSTGYVLFGLALLIAGIVSAANMWRRQAWTSYRGREHLTRAKNPEKFWMNLIFHVFPIGTGVLFIVRGLMPSWVGYF